MILLSSTKKIVIEAPIDPELNVNTRENLEYYITFPTGYDVDKDYPLVFCIAGYGDDASSKYQLEKLRPYIADKYNALVVGVRYHNDMRMHSNKVRYNSMGICNFYGIDMSYFKNPADTNQVIEDIFKLIVSRNIASLDTRLSIEMEPYHKYSSFGFMPAIDHLIVLYHILKNYKVDKKNIIAFGSSYGGYIASLMAKYAPNTFSLVIDNSGFCMTQLQEVYGGKIGGAGASIPRIINGKRYEIPIATSTVWSLDETSEYYFSDSHKQIRSLLIKDHRTPSSTVYFCYHSVKDVIAPINYKDEMYKLLSEFNKTFYKRVTDEDIDGKLFKNTLHSMNASLREMFDVSIKRYKEFNYTKQDDIDFDRNVVYGFQCLDKVYNFSYTNKGIDVYIEKL